MDFVLLAIVVFFCLKGAVKGFVATLFSLIGTISVALISWKLCGVCFSYVENMSFVQNDLFQIIKNLLDELLPGTFSSMEEVESAFSNSSINQLFLLVFAKLVGDISFEGEMSFGQIFAPTLTTLLVKVVTFLAFFVGLSLLTKFAKWIIEKTIKVCGLSFGNRILGGLVGAVKGAMVFCIVYIVLISLANFIPNIKFLEFVQSGEISKKIYNIILNFILNKF